MIICPDVCQVLEETRRRGPCSQILTSGVVYKFQCGLRNESYYGECVRHLTVRSSEYIASSPLTNTRLQPRKDGAACHDLLNSNYSPTFDDFSVLRHENKKYLIHWKKAFLLWEIDHEWIGTYVPHLSICLNEFLSHFLLRSVDLCDQFFAYFYHCHKKEIVWKHGWTGSSMHLCWEPSYTRTHSSLPGIKM